MSQAAKPGSADRELACRGEECGVRVALRGSSFSDGTTQTERELPLRAAGSIGLVTLGTWGSVGDSESESETGTEDSYLN